MDHSAFLALDETMQTRKQVFSALSRLLGKEVDEDLLASLKADGVLQTDDEAMAKALAMVDAYLASDEASVLDLARDYAKAFCGAGSTNRDSAYPFESFYTSKERMLMQEARDDALRWYRRFGMEKNPDWHDCEDHVGVELEFAAYLVEAYCTAVADGNDERAGELLVAQRDFERDHLANWLPLFAADAQMRCRTDFYKGLTRLADVFVREDLAALESLLEA